MTSKRTLTKQQQLAVDTRSASIVLSSGAGCGKTTVLTERYLSHLREGAEVAQIVAITFTARAARQMRDRIRKEVTANVHSAPTDADADVWAKHLRGLETAPISTIHAFCGALLRQNAIEAGLDPRFEVLEEVLSVNLKAEALNAGLQRLLTAPTAAGEDLKELVLLYGWRSVVDAVDQLLSAWDDRSWQKWLTLPAAEIIRHWQGYVSKKLLPRYLAYLFKSKPKVARCLLLLRRHPPLPGEMAGRVAFILEKTAQLGRAHDAAATIDELIEAAKVGRSGSKAWPDAEVYEAVKKAFEQFRGELKSWDLQALTEPGENLEAVVAAGKQMVRVVGEVVQTYRHHKRRRGVVDFQDLLLQARDLLRDHPEVCDRMRERYRYLLIDELQDTDPVQMELVEYLCGATLKTGKLFSVGDHNQSIYRFRGADVQLFRELRDQIPVAGRQQLTLNYRSQPAVLEFTNALLQNHLPDYEPLEAKGQQVNPNPCVEFLWSARPEKSNVAEARALEADWIARRIAAMVGRELLVRDDSGLALRPVELGDVVLLFRAMSNVHLYEAALRDFGLDYYLVGGRAFFAQQEIYDLLNLCRALENPQDGVSVAGTLRSPFCCVSDEALFVLAKDRRGLWAGLLDETLEPQLPADQQAPIARARRHLTRWRSLKDRLPIARLLGTVFAESGYDAATQFEHLGDRKLANLWKLLDLARTFDCSGLFGLPEFLTRLGDLVQNQPREEQAATQPENADVVRLMTIHQAKGLEFPVVIVPDVVAAGGGAANPVARWDAELGCVVRPPADEEPAPFPKFAWRLWEARNELDEYNESLRTLYVACTRARDFLILSGALPADYQPGNAWMTTLAERFDLRTGQGHDPTIAAGRQPRVRAWSRLDEFDLSAEEYALRAKALMKKTDCIAPRLPTLPAPVPAQSQGSRVLTIAELEQRLGDRRNGAELPVEKLDTARSPLEEALRTVLQIWDYRDPHTLQNLARHCAADCEWTGDLERLLERFADSETCRELTAAQSRQWNVEYALPLAPDGPIFQGVVDCVWQDADAKWHLLYFTLEPVPKAEREHYWKLRQREIVLAATAMQRQTGSGPKTVQICLVDDWYVIRRNGNRLPHKAVVEEVAALFHANGTP
jgi:ATP-dependent helicase/nuclease subunit A